MNLRVGSYGRDVVRQIRLPRALDSDTVWMYSLPMDRTQRNPVDVTWVAWCTERLREQWPRADATSLQEAAQELWADEALRASGPRQAAEKWLRKGIPMATPIDRPRSTT